MLQIPLMKDKTTCLITPSYSMPHFQLRFVEYTCSAKGEQITKLDFFILI